MRGFESVAVAVARVLSPGTFIQIFQNFRCLISRTVPGSVRASVDERDTVEEIRARHAHADCITYMGQTSIELMM
jgi:hypothetical protein